MKTYTHRRIQADEFLTTAAAGGGAPGDAEEEDVQDDRTKRRGRGPQFCEQSLIRPGKIEIQARPPAVTAGEVRLKLKHLAGVLAERGCDAIVFSSEGSMRWLTGLKHQLGDIAPSAPSPVHALVHVADSGCARIIFVSKPARNFRQDNRMNWMEKTERPDDSRPLAVRGKKEHKDEGDHGIGGEGVCA